MVCFPQQDSGLWRATFCSAAPPQPSPTIRLQVRKLVRALLQPPRRVNIAEGTPLYGRLAAVLSPCFRHLSSELSAALLEDFEQAEAASKPPPRPNPPPLPTRVAFFLLNVAPPIPYLTLDPHLPPHTTPPKQQPLSPPLLSSPLPLLQMRESQGGRDLSARLANIQYIAELIKFRVLPTASAFKCLKDMLDSFSPANVQVSSACA